MEEKEILTKDECFDSEDIKKLIDLSKKVMSHDIDQVYVKASILAIILGSEKTREKVKGLMGEVIDEKLGGEKFRWSQESQRLDWGHYIHLPKWLGKNLPPFPFALWQLAVTVSLVMIIFFEMLNYFT